MMSFAELYPYVILVALLGSMMHVLLLLAYRNRVAPWRAKFVYALGAMVFFSWLFFRVWEGAERGTEGTICAILYVVGLIYLIVSYRRSPYLGDPHAK